MARYKAYDYRQGKFIPVSFDKQILPGTFEFTLNYLIDNKLDLSVFDDRDGNDDTGAPVYDPAILLKIIIYAYSRGITSSRKIEQCCQENVIFMALSCDTKPHFATIADFISTLSSEIVRLFLEVLLVCDAMNLIGKEMFAIDGVKLPGNTSKAWSGTKEELSHKKEKMEEAIRTIMTRHKETDEESLPDQEEKYIVTLAENIKMGVDDSSRSGHLAEIPLYKQNNWVTIIMRLDGVGGSWMTAGASAFSNVILELPYSEAAVRDALTEGAK